ncbi:hypothetical protein [Prochlorococcus sp. MIT 1303]|uniref:hypothetical protein n=1 Tax=Prochlorococcus sp. MIT 1303 TaxID=1723647 RepID=UPI0007B3616B|nr:hypothetical protein [Prochlorococcus sp. MIT 1303]
MTTPIGRQGQRSVDDYSGAMWMSLTLSLYGPSDGAKENGYTAPIFRTNDWSWIGSRLEVGVLWRWVRARLETA